MARLIGILLLATLLPAPAPAADAPLPAPLPLEVETFEVDRAERDRTKHPTLRFLRGNRDFFRGRLDALLVRSRLDRTGAGRELDPRFLRWIEMLAAIRAAADSAAAGEERLAQDALLESVAGLAAIEADLDTMERLLAEQGERLAGLEEDFAGRQLTAMVVLLTGVPAGGAPTAVVLDDPAAGRVRVELDAAARAALERGGSAELLHEAVEPREHRLAVTLAGEGWESPPQEIVLEPARDRLTFLELDVSGLAPRDAAGIAARTWTR